MKVSINSRSRRIAFRAQSTEDKKALLDLVYGLSGKPPKDSKESEQAKSYGGPAFEPQNPLQSVGHIPRRSRKPAAL